MPIENLIEKLPPEAQHALRDKAGQELDTLATSALDHDAVLETLIACLTEKNEVLRYNAVRALERLAGQNPARLYPAWDTLATLLDSPNGFHRAAAVALLADVLPADTRHRFDALFERYLNLLGDSKAMVARYLVINTVKVVLARPDLAPRVTAHLLTLEGTGHPPSSKDLLRGDILEAFEAYAGHIPPTSREAILAFAGAARTCSSPRTRKIAQQYLLTHAVKD